MANTIKSPGPDAPPEAHLQFLIDLNNHVVNSTPPENYMQMPHGEGKVIGDITQPSMLNASYKYIGGSTLVSFSIPNYIKLEKEITFDLDENGRMTNIKANQGLTANNMLSSFKAFFAAYGIEMDEFQMKSAEDKLSNTRYVEAYIDPNKYEYAKVIMDKIAENRTKSSAELMAQIRLIDPKDPTKRIPEQSDLAKPTVSVEDTQKPTSHKILATTEITEAFKGEKKVTYLGVGKTPADIDTLKAALQKQGFEEGKHYTVVPSSLNQGGDVIKLSDAGITKIDNLKENFQAAKPIEAAVAQPPKAPSSQLTHSDDREQFADPNNKRTTQTTPSASSSGDLPAGGRVESHKKVTGSGVGVGMGVYGLTQKYGEDGTAAGDLRNKDTRIMAQAGIVADSAAILVDTVDGISGLKKVSDSLNVASKVSRVAAPVGVALSVASGVLDYKIAEKTKDASRASDAIGGSTGGIAGAAAGGIVGTKTGAAIGAAVGVWFGGIGAAPGAVIGGFAGGILGAIGGAFAGSEVGKKVAEVTIKDSIQKKYDEEKRAEITQLKSMPKDALAKTIQNDPTMVDTVSFKGNHVNLATALEDKDFRTKFLRTLEAETKGGANRTEQIAMIKAYGEKIDAGQPANPTATPVAQAVKPASPQAVAQTAILNAKYNSMTATQLANAILNDPVLPDTVPMGKTNVPIKEAIKDGAFRDKLIVNLEARQNKGEDYTTQIAMLKAYDDKMDSSAQPTAPAQVAQVQQPVQALSSIPIK